MTPVINNVKGLGLMSLGFFTFAAGDALAKLLTDYFHPLQIVWFRTLGLFLGVCLLLAIKGMSVLRTPRPYRQVLRGVAAVGSATCFIVALGFVPLADAVAVSFIAPFMVTVLGAILLKEPVGFRRWFAVVVGFIGMLIVIRPGQGVFHPAIFLIIAAATFFAIRQLLSRWLSGVDSIETTVAYTAIVSFSITGIAQIFFWIWPGSLKEIFLIAGLTLSAAIGEIMIIRALDMAQSVVLAPCHYTLIIYSTVYGLILFNDFPDRGTLIGCSVIVLSGLYTIYREYSLSKLSVAIKSGLSSATDINK